MTRPRPSPVAYEVRIGIAMLDQVLAGDSCPIATCKGAPGEHAAGCLIGEAILNSPRVAEMARGARARRTR